LGNLDLHQEGEFLSLVQDDTVLLTSVNGHVEAPEQVSPEAAETLQGWVKEQVWMWREVPSAAAIPENNFDLEPTVEDTLKADTASPLKEPTVQAGQPSDSSTKPQSETSEPQTSQLLGTVQVVQMQFAAIAEGPARQFFQRLAKDLGEQATKSVGQLRRGLESDEFNWSLDKFVVSKRSALETDRSVGEAEKALPNSVSPWIVSLT
jgi:hypothetical protein